MTEVSMGSPGPRMVTTGAVVTLYRTHCGSGTVLCHVRSHSRSLHSNPVRWVLSMIPSLQMSKWRQRRVWLIQPVSGRGSVQSWCPGLGSSALQVGSARGSTAGVDAALAVGGVEPSCKSWASEPPGGPAGSPHGPRTEAGKTWVTVQWYSQQDMEALGLLCLPLAVCL